MLEIGTIQNLTVVKKVDFGVYLAEPGEEDKRVLLPARQVPPQTSGEFFKIQHNQRRICQGFRHDG